MIEFVVVCVSLIILAVVIYKVLNKDFKTKKEPGRITIVANNNIDEIIVTLEDGTILKRRDVLDGEKVVFEFPENLDATIKIIEGDKEYEI